MGNRFKRPKFHILIEIVSKLALRADLSIINPNIKNQKILDLKDPLYALGEEERICLESEAFALKTLRYGYITQNFAQLFSVFCFENEAFSKKIAKIVLKKLNKHIEQDLKKLFILIEELLLMPDSLQQKRIEWLIGFPTVKLAVGSSQRY